MLHVKFGQIPFNGCLKRFSQSEARAAILYDESVQRTQTLKGILRT